MTKINRKEVEAKFMIRMKNVMDEEDAKLIRSDIRKLSDEELIKYIDRFNINFR